MNNQGLNPIQYGVLYLLFGLGLACMAYGFYMCCLGWLSHSWPSTMGKVKWVDKYRWGYTYTVSGTEYYGKREDFGDIKSEDGDIERLRKEYPEGKTIRVYYSPNTHARCVLKPRIGNIWWLPFLAGGFFSTFAAAQFWYFKNRANKNLSEGVLENRPAEITRPPID